MGRYELNKEYAIAGDNVGSSGGKFESKCISTGTITCALEITAGTGSHGIMLEYTDDSGYSVRNQRFYTYSADWKKPLYGLNLINSLMTCLKVRNIEGTQGTYERYDWGQRRNVQETGVLFKDLMNKKIGVIIQPEEYEYNGEKKTRPMIRGFFEADTGLTSYEIFKGEKVPKKRDQMLAALADVKLIENKQGDCQATVPQESNEKDEEDIPF